MEGGAKRIVAILAVAAIAALGVFWYWQRSKQRALESGNVYVKNQTSDQTQPTPPAEQTPANSASVQPEAPVAPKTSAAQPPAPKPSAGVQHIPAAGQQAHIEPIPAAQPHAAAIPVADTMPRNPPNGFIFAGSGKYQLYRQGDITWRLDTNTGRACIIFATDTMWSKVRVWDAGCGAS